MKKRILSFVVVLLLLVSLVSMIACDSAKPATRQEEESTFTVGGDGSVDVAKGTQRIKATSKQVFDIYTADSTTEQKASYAVKVVDVNEKEQNVAVTAVDGNYFKVLAPFGGYKTGEWYEISLKDGFSFVNFDDTSKISFYVAGDDSVEAKFAEDVVLVMSDYIKDAQEDAKGNIWFNYNVAASGQNVRVGQVLVTDDEKEGQIAYEITSVDVKDGVARCSAKKPEVDTIYESLMVTEKATLNKDVAADVTPTISENSEALQQLEEIAAAAFGFEAGKAKFNVSFDVKETNVFVKIDMTIPDLIQVEGSENKYLDLVLSFGIESEIDVLTDLSLGSLISAKDKGLTIEADIKNTLSFSAAISDSITIDNQTALDDILNKISAMVKDLDENDVTIDIFNWIIPIGNGVASITYNADVVMNFGFSGELNVVSSSSLDFKAAVKYVPGSESPVSLDLSEPKFTFDEVRLNLAAEIHAKIGLYNDISFDLLGGVLGLGIYAEVGNYNDVYGAINTLNLLEELDASYGFYFEGGVYYDVGVHYSVAKLVNGSKSFFDGEKYLPLYDLGHKMQVMSFKETDGVVNNKVIKVGPEAMEIDLVALQKNLVTKAVAIEKVDPSKFKDYEDTYVFVKDGKIGFTAAGIGSGDPRQVDLYADGLKITVTLELIAHQEADSEADLVVIGGIKASSANEVTAMYLDGKPVSIKYNVKDSTVTIAKDALIKDGTILIYVNGVAQKIVYVK